MEVAEYLWDKMDERIVGNKAIKEAYAKYRKRRKEYEKAKKEFDKQPKNK
jgi:hypothetical protein